MRLLLELFKHFFHTLRAKHKEAQFAADSIYRFYNPALFFRHASGNGITGQIFSIDCFQYLFRNSNNFTLATAQTKNFHFGTGETVRGFDKFCGEEAF